MTCFARGRHDRLCDNAKQRHHVVKKQHIRGVHASRKAAQRRGGPPPFKLGRALNDSRLYVWVCWAHHQLEHSGKLVVLPSDLPPGFWDAVDEYGLAAYVPGNLEREAV